MLNRTVILFLLTLILFLGCDMPSKKNTLQSIQTGSLPPEFSGYTLDDNEVRLSSFKGKIIMLVFWKTWCEACKQELQDMTYVREKYGDELMIFAINIGESKDTIRFFKRRLRLNFPIVMDQDLIISSSYGITLWPTTIIINKEGLIHWIGVGLEMEKIKKEIENLLMS